MATARLEVKHGYTSDEIDLRMKTAAGPHLTHIRRRRMAAAGDELDVFCVLIDHATGGIYVDPKTGQDMPGTYDELAILKIRDQGNAKRWKDYNAAVEYFCPWVTAKGRRFKPYSGPPKGSTRRPGFTKQKPKRGTPEHAKASHGSTLAPSTQPEPRPGGTERNG
jgi:hypothetical protein